MPLYNSLEEEFFQRTMGIPVTVQNHIQGKTFCFTGALSSMVRHRARELVSHGGGHWTESVTGATQLLVAGSIPRTAIISGQVSLKMQKARRNGTEIISEETFLQMLEDAGLPKA